MMGRKILIIDDDTDLLAVMQEVLNYAGFEVFTSPVGDGYKNLIRQNNIDLVIIDYLLHGANGGDICHKIKCCPEFWHLPVVIYSAYPQVFLQSLGTYGCDAFIPKPFELSDIIGQVSKLLRCSANHFVTDQYTAKHGAISAF